MMRLRRSRFAPHAPSGRNAWTTRSRPVKPRTAFVVECGRSNARHSRNAKRGTPAPAPDATTRSPPDRTGHAATIPDAKRKPGAKANANALDDATKNANKTHRSTPSRVPRAGPMSSRRTGARGSVSHAGSRRGSMLRPGGAPTSAPHAPGANASHHSGNPCTTGAPRSRKPQPTSTRRCRRRHDRRVPDGCRHPRNHHRCRHLLRPPHQKVNPS